MARGYLRRDAARRHPFRWLGTILLNVHRGENEPVQAPEEVMWLYGDPMPEQPKLLTTEEVEVEYARSSALDADLLSLWLISLLPSLLCLALRSAVSKPRWPMRAKS